MADKHEHNHIIPKDYLIVDVTYNHSPAKKMILTKLRCVCGHEVEI
jgi:hypothetical protein